MAEELSNIIKKAALYLSEIKKKFDDEGMKVYEDAVLGVKEPFNTALQVAQLAILLDIRKKLDILVRVQ